MNRTDILPASLRGKFGHLRFVKKRTLIEYSAECPVCRDTGHLGRDMPDRFRMFDDAKPLGWCRQCGHLEFANNDWHRISPEEQHHARVARERLAEKERRRRSHRIQQLQAEAAWKAYHDCMADRERGLWRDEGIPDSIQDWFELGYTPDKVYGHQDQLYTSPALTIPYQDREQVVNVQFKILRPVNNEVGKYRFTTGIPTSLFWTEPKKERKGRALVVEGAKKAIISWMHIGDKYDHVVAVPSKTPAFHLLDTLSEFDESVLVLDPDAYVEDKDGRSRAQKVAEGIGLHTRIARLPGKIDDLLTRKLATPKDVYRILQQGRRLSF